MSGCFPSYTIGNVAFSQPATGGYCTCLCHLGLTTTLPTQCYCSCNRTQKFELISDNSMALTLKNLQNELHVLRRTVEFLEKCIKRKPYKCPICDGKCGHIVDIDVGLEPVFIDCKACKGKGLIWDITVEELTRHRL